MEMKFKDFTVVETQFANQYLKQWTKATVHQDRIEHWDVKGILPIISMEHELKFDVKARKRISRLDISFQDDYTWIEGTNVLGNPGWLKGKADYIVFELKNHWLIVNRSILHTFINARLYENGFKEGKGIYEIYTRMNTKDKITLAIVDDLARLEGSKKLRKYL